MHFTQILHGERLAANQVGGGFHADVGDALAAMLLNGRLQSGKVRIALEGVGALGLEGIHAEKLEHFSASQIDMSLGCGEVVIHLFVWFLNFILPSVQDHDHFKCEKLTLSRQTSSQ